MKRKKTVYLVSVVILIISLPIIIFLVGNQTNNRSRAAAPDKLETEGGVLSALGVSKGSDSLASGGQYVLFANQTLTPTQAPLGSLPAFPGAQGSGALAKGGRGGAIIEVTNLNDSGTGSLRACVEASGPRTCVFRVSGTIVSCRILAASNPYLTIAGQTSPGGIQLVAAKSGENCTPSGSGPNNNTLLRIVTHDVIVRYLRFRHGKTDPVTGNQNGHPMTINDGAYNSIIDHNSIYWTQDENIGIWVWNEPYSHEITISHNIITEPLLGHSTNVIIGTNEGAAVTARLVNFDFHHNFIGTSTHRNPQAKLASMRWINNIVYNYGSRASQTTGSVRADFINNIYKYGPFSKISQAGTLAIGTRGVSTPGVREIIWYDTSGTPSLYVTGNKTPHHLDPAITNTEWNDIVGEGKDPPPGNENTYDKGPLPTSYRRATPLSYLSGVPPIVAEPAATLENTLGLGSGSATNPVGASRRLDCLGKWISAYDSNDLRVINEYKNSTGPTSPVDDGTRSSIASGAACTDSDHDGMPDVWETSKGLNPNSASDRNNIAPNGYTQLENYLNGV